MTSIVVVRIESSCMDVGLYTRCFAGFSNGVLPPATDTQQDMLHLMRPAVLLSWPVLLRNMAHWK